MILVDVNLLVYVIDEDSPFHAQAIAWWEPQLQSGDLVGLGWNSLFGFLRVITNSRAVPKPLSLEVACQRVDDGWRCHKCGLFSPQRHILRISNGCCTAAPRRPS